MKIEKGKEREIAAMLNEETFLSFYILWQDNIMI